MPKAFKPLLLGFVTSGSHSSRVFATVNTVISMEIARYFSRGVGSINARYRLP